jgi:maltokinase
VSRRPDHPPTRPARSTVIDAQAFAQSLAELLPDFLAGQRWFAAVDDPVARIRRVDTLVDDWPTLLWVLAEVRGDGGRGQPVWYQLPLGASPELPAELPAAAHVGRLATPRGEAHLFDALSHPELSLMFCQHIAPTLEISAVRPQPGEQSNTSVVLDERYIAKLFRRVQPGPNPDVEVTEALGRVGFGGVPVPVAVWRRADTDFAVVRRFERTRGDGVELATASLREMFNRRRPPRDCRLDFAGDAYLLGRDVAKLHVALAEAFGAEPAQGAVWADDMAAQLHRVSAGHLNVKRIEHVYQRLRHADDLGSAIRIHGDLHLGQVLRLARSWMVLDFEGEPARPLDERRRPSSPLRDVAGMTRSFHYASGLALRESGLPDDELRLLADAWAERNVNAFLSGYADIDEVHRLLPSARVSRDALLSVFELDKAVYEVAYELAHRPELVDLPVQAVERLLDGDEELPDHAPGPTAERRT